MSRKSKTLADRFWAKVEKRDGCWGWTASKHHQGYGFIGTGGNGKIIKAHRASWIIHFGEIPEGKCVLHKCDNTECTNPDHLFLGTQVENIRDMVNKGRNFAHKGQDHSSSKLIDSDVLCILARANEHAQKIAEEYGVVPSTVWRIWSRKSWKHLTTKSEAAS